MKKILFALLAGFVPALVVLNVANAQNPGSLDIPGPQKNVIEINKEATPAEDHIDDLEIISPKALKSFAKTYKNVKGESWMKIMDGFSAKFISNGIRNSIFYNTNGKWFGNLKGYSEDKLPYEIRDIVKRKYYDYSITYVEEVETIDSYGIPTYVIHLEDKNNIKLMRISDGEMDVMKEFKKS